MRTALTIAGSDSSGGAGIQADIKTMMANGVFAMSAITAMTAQNTTGVTAIMDATPEFLKAELDEVFTDIFPDAVKIGMVSKSSLIRQQELSLRGSLQRRTQCQRRERPSVPGRLLPVVLRKADRQPEYARHGLHALERHCLESCQRL